MFSKCEIFSSSINNKNDMIKVAQRFARYHNGFTCGSTILEIKVFHFVSII